MHSIQCLYFLLVIIILIDNPGFAQQLAATEIIEQADKLIRGETSQVEATMTIVRPTWTREMSMKSWTKGTDKALILITAPARDRGTAFLKIGNEIWNWVPSIEEVIKLPPSMMMQSWMGSDFTNDDLVKESSIVKDYTHKLIGDTTVMGYDCWKIELTSKPEAAVVWGKIITYISKEGFMTLLTKFYDEDGVLVNVMKASEIKEFSGKKLPSKLELIPVDKPGHKTILQYQNIVFDQPIDDAFFSIQNMKRLR